MMVRDVAAQLSILNFNDSNWYFVNDLDNQSSRIPPSNNLQYLNSTLENLTYSYLRYKNETVDPVFQAGLALDYLFRPNTFSYSALCAYPISGQYGFLNRLLFYLLMIFALLVRKHTWLVSAALGTAMTYAASAAVHAFALLARYKYSIPAWEKALENPKAAKANDLGDLDLEGIFPILVASCIMLTPILDWSVGVRERARAVTVCWGMLMFAAVVPTFWKIWEGVYPMFVVGQLVTCNTDVTQNCTLDYILSNRFTPAFSLNFYNKCNCNDTCGAISLADAPFRKGQGVQAFLVSDKTSKLTRKNSVYWANVVDALFLCFMIGHGVLGLLEIHFTQAGLRNKVFLLLAGRIPYYGRVGFASKARYYIAKATASLSFMLAIMAAIVAPAVFISSVIINEINVWGYPVSERFDAVGQWSTYVCAMFVLIAAVIQEAVEKYPPAWENWWPSIKKKPKATDAARHASSPGERGSDPISTTEGQNEDNSILGIRRSYKRVRDVLKDFRKWWQDPTTVSLEANDRPRSPSTNHLLGPSTELSTLEGSPMPIHASTMPLLSTSRLVTQNLNRPTAYSSPPSESSLTTPLIPPTNRLASPQPAAGGNSYSDDPASMRDTVQRHTFERRSSGV